NQGVTDANDAIAAATKEGYLAGSSIFLDVERTDATSIQLRDYYQSWARQILSASQFRPGIYCSDHNALEIYGNVLSVYQLKNRKDVPPFWIVGRGTGFDLTKPPTGSGFSFATVWQDNN